MARFTNQMLLGNQYVRVYDKSTHETIEIKGAKVFFFDDFLGKYEDVYTASSPNAPWLEKITGAAPPTIVMLDSIGGGALSLNLTNANQKQEAGITFNDYKNFNIDKGIVFEARVAVNTTPTDQAELYFGLANNYVEGPIAEADAGPTVHAFFNFDAALTPTIHTDDASNDNNAVATGVTEVEGTYSIFRIDILTPTSAKFYIDGARVASSTTFNMSNGTNVVLQPFLMAHKETGAGVGALYIDYVKVWQLER